MTEKLLNRQLDEQFKTIEYNYNVIEENITRAANAVEKKREDIIFLAATKTVSPQLINHAIKLGLSYIGENKVQELLEKYENYNLEKCDLQFIGHLQTNKVRQIADKVNLIQSVDTMKLAKEIGKQAIKNNKTIGVLVEVNVGKEESKSGIMPEAAAEFIDEIREIKGISIKGLMSIPPICDEKEKISKYFSYMNKLFIDIKGKKMDNVSMDFLSMGMSSDYEEAILQGANMVRIGSSLFGSRIYR